MSRRRLRIETIRRAQIRTFESAAGRIYTTERGQELIEAELRTKAAASTVAFCGVDLKYLQKPRVQEPIENYSQERPFKWLYVSTIDAYKHQDKVVAAAAELRREGLPISLLLVGSGYPQDVDRLLATIGRVDPDREFIAHLRHEPEVLDKYLSSDAAVFASSCETPSFVVMESMAAGIPLACSSRSGIPEALGNAGEYFDPEDPTSISDAMRTLMQSPERRLDLATRAHERATRFSWAECADDTFAVVAAVSGRA
jgi:glycosyltransferase involved in cell wall biosynthesis